MKNLLLFISISSLLHFVPFKAFCQNQSEAAKLHAEVEEMIFSDPDAALEIAEQEITLAKKGSEEYVTALNDKGKCLYFMDRYPEAERILDDALNEAVIINCVKEKADVLYSLGDLRILQGKYGTAIENLGEGLAIYQKLNDVVGIADCLNCIGIIHLQQENYEKALDYFNRALEFGDGITKGDSYTHIGGVYLKMEVYDEAIEYSQKALESGRKNNDQYVVSSALDYLGTACLKTGKGEEAAKYFAESLVIKKELEDLQGEAITLLNMGLNYKNMQKNDSAIYYVRKSYNLSNEIGAKKEIRNSSMEFSKLLAMTGDFDSAFVIQNHFIQINDEINNEKASKKIAELEADINAEKQEQKIALLEKDKMYQKQIKKYYVYIGVALFLFFIAIVVFMYNRYKMKKKSAEVLEVKNQIIEEKNKDIMDSIRYAQRIQEAILPPVSYIRKFIPDTFVLYLPKDVVAGDFYWMDNFNDKIFYAACDCTGHGVPGAMVSVMCSNYLKRVVREMHLSDPGRILDEVTKLVIENFEKSQNEVKDGMDMSLCVFDPDFKTVHWAGANNPLWILRSDSAEIEEVKANKQPVGKYLDPKPFTSHNINLNKGDLLYMFSDGYADQFGGAAGKKLKSANFKKLILTNRNESIDKQKEIIKKVFIDWRADIEQVDDVCVIGIRI